jgi:hypothetical protein
MVAGPLVSVGMVGGSFTTCCEPAAAARSPSHPTHPPRSRAAGADTPGRRAGPAGDRPERAALSGGSTAAAAATIHPSSPSGLGPHHSIAGCWPGRLPTSSRGREKQAWLNRAPAPVRVGSRNTMYQQRPALRLIIDSPPNSGWRLPDDRTEREQHVRTDNGRELTRFEQLTADLRFRAASFRPQHVTQHFGAQPRPSAAQTGAKDGMPSKGNWRRPVYHRRLIPRQLRLMSLRLEGSTARRRPDSPNQPVNGAAAGAALEPWRSARARDLAPGVAGGGNAGRIDLRNLERRAPVPDCNDHSHR